MMNMIKKLMMRNVTTLTNVINKQIIGIDISHAEDQSCISAICSKCRIILEVKHYDRNVNNLDVTLFKKCPKCNVKFSKYEIIQ